MWTHIGQYDTWDLLKTPAPWQRVDWQSAIRVAATQMELPGVGLPSLNSPGHVLARGCFLSISDLTVDRAAQLGELSTTAGYP